jgi:signal transduction histidine kinase
MNVETDLKQEKHLLVVDDEEGPRQSLNVIFGDVYSVTMAGSGEEAVELAKQQHFQVVVTDIRMQGLSGIDVLRSIKQIDPRTQVIVLTAFETLETARQAITLGATDYLRKPFDLEHIQTVVERAFDNFAASADQEKAVRDGVNAAKENFLQIVSHELNTPSNGILGFIELLADTDLNEEQAEYVSTIRQCSEKYFEITQDILAYAQISMSENEVATGAFNPATLVLKLIAEAQVDDGVTLVHELPENLPEVVVGAENEVRIIIRKLLDNAIKFTDEGSVRLAVELKPTSVDRSRLTIRVSDTGRGIAPDLVASGRIFDPFAQADSSMSRAHEGLGLGLSLCRSLANRLQADLRVESSLGSGSTFTFSLDVETDGGSN